MPVTAVVHPQLGNFNSGDFTQSAIDFVPITPSDTDELVHYARGFRVSGTAGNVEVVTFYGTTRIIPAVQLYETVLVQIKQIKAANTTATGIQAIV